MTHPELTSTADSYALPKHPRPRASSRPVTLLDLEPRTDSFLEECLAGLRRAPRTLPCKYFYDRRGSRLFDAICELPEYYPTRTELAIMRAHARAMGAACGPDVMIVEFGSGSSLKTRLLLEALERPAACVPVDISREHLLQAAEALAERFVGIEVLPVCADFTRPFRLPTPRVRARRRVVYFPGSTIGNFTPERAEALLGQIAALAGADGGLLIGIDLKKDPAVLERAYNDRQGVTAQFNLNLLVRMNRELAADFNLGAFRHRAVYDARHGRVEMRLISQRRQTVHLGGEAFTLDADEVIVTEHSHKYAVDEFSELAARAGLHARATWRDPDARFCVLYLSRR